LFLLEVWNEILEFSVRRACTEEVYDFFYLNVRHRRASGRGQMHSGGA